METLLNAAHEQVDDRAQAPPAELHQLADRIWTHGVATLSDAELLGMLLRTGHQGRTAVQVAHDVLAQCGGDLFALHRLSAWELAALPGLGRHRTALILAATEFGRRRHTLDPRDRHCVSTSATAHELLRSVLQDLPHEEFWLLLLDRGNRLIERVRISQGGLHGTVADPKVIFKAALDRRASSIVLGHNHPSGQLRPSEEDIRLTRKLVEGARMLDLTIMDHLIVTAWGYYSFSDNGMM